MIHIYHFLSTLKLSILLASTESLENNGMLKKVEFHPFLAQNGCFRVPSLCFVFVFVSECREKKNYTSIHYVLYVSKCCPFLLKRNLYELDGKKLTLQKEIFLKILLELKSKYCVGKKCEKKEKTIRATVPEKFINYVHTILN